MECEALCRTERRCGSYEYLTNTSDGQLGVCKIFDFKYKITKANGKRGSTCHVSFISNAKGYWAERDTAYGASLSHAVSIGSSTTLGDTVTETIGAQISLKVKESVMFAGAEETYGASVSTADSISASLTKTITTTDTATCESRGNKQVTLYQWVVET